MMNLDATLDAIGRQLRLDPQALKAYASEDTLGGWHPEPSLRKWHMGSVWEVEGQTLYALVRALQPELIIECGSFYGCSTHHIMEALLANGRGRIISIDNAIAGAGWKPEARYASIVQQVHAEAIQWLIDNDIHEAALIFEDLMHTTEMTQGVWATAMRKCARGTVIVSHDAAHYIVGADIMRGIHNAGAQGVEVYLTEPSACGLAIGRL